MMLVKFDLGARRRAPDGVHLVLHDIMASSRVSRSASSSYSCGLVFGARAILALVLAACGGDPAEPTCTVSAIAVTPSTTTVEAGGTSQLAATVTASNCASTPAPAWTTSDGGVATVNGSGLVTAIAPGAATISAAAGGQTASATVTVTPIPVATVSVALSARERIVGQTVTATATVRSAGGTTLTGRAVTWSSSAPAIATVDPLSGAVSAVALGQVIVRATVDGIIGQDTLWVVPALESDRFAFALLGGPTTFNEPVFGDPDFTLNAAGGRIIVRRRAVGLYEVTVERLGKGARPFVRRETVMATAWGGAPRYCSANQWNDTPAGDLLVFVRCYDLSGTLSEGAFTLAVIGANTLAGSHGFTWNATLEGAVNGSYAFTTGTGPISITRSGPGRYLAGLQLPGLSRSVAIVSPYTLERTCWLESWNRASGEVGARCTNATGTTLSDASFTTLVTSAGRAGRRWGFAFNAEAGTMAPGQSWSPEVALQGQSNGLTPRIEWLDRGVYKVRFPGLAGSNVRVTALASVHGQDAPGPCALGGWTTEGADFIVQVRCHSFVTGFPENARFSLLVLE
ncbi:MAG: Ig-like domain-containing protein [Gemmatimonadaceae bacterium]|jgi:hypothetical protein|nr:Ig-like domain-containing protein [Gemmatimonadaceae bacterium]